jgi:SAM-dependent methyltransferase
MMAVGTYERAPGRGEEGRPGDTVVDAAGNAFVLRAVSCPICERSDERRVGLRGGRYHRYGLGVVSRIVACRTCGLLYPSPFPIPREPEKLYGDPAKYFEHHDEEGKVREFRGTIREAIRLSGRARPSLLDVGSGRAELLRAAVLEGLDDTLGLDFAPAMIEHARARGIELRPLTIEAYAASAGRTFDVITLSAVLEHVYDPNAMIAACRALLRPGGVLYIDVPRDPNLFTDAVHWVHRVRASPAVVNLSPTFPPFHVFGFTERSLGLLLDKHEFAIESLRIESSIDAPHDGRLKDRVLAFGARQLYRLGNATGRAANLFVWARRQ